MVMDGCSNGPIQWLTHTHKHMIDGADGSRFCCDATANISFLKSGKARKQQLEEKEEEE